MAKHTKSKPKHKPTVNCKNCSCVCIIAYHQALLEYTIQQRTVPIIFPLILQTTSISQMLGPGAVQLL